MTSARWLFVILILWIGATIWSKSLEPAETELLPSEIITTIVGDKTTNEPGLSNSNLATSAGLVKIWDWAEAVWKALVFDYAWFDGWVIGTILRIICMAFTVAGLYFIADIIWKIRSILLGQ